MAQTNQQTPATVLQPTDCIFGDQDSGAKDVNGNTIFQTRKFLGSAFQGNGAPSLPPGSLAGNPLSSGASNFGQSISYDQSQMVIDSTVTLRLLKNFEKNIAATGSLQSDAYQLTKRVSWIATTPVGAGVIVPAMATMDELEIWNLDPNNILAVWPLAGGQINYLWVNTAYGVAPKGGVMRIRVFDGTPGATILFA
jgi:hypothetical protein